MSSKSFSTCACTLTASALTASSSISTSSFGVRQRVKPALALSLHTTKAALRAQLLPRAPRFDPADLVAAGERYARATGYRVQYQWTLIEGVNDGDGEVEGSARQRCA